MPNIASWNKKVRLASGHFPFFSQQVMSRELSSKGNYFLNTASKSYIEMVYVFSVKFLLYINHFTNSSKANSRSFNAFNSWTSLHSSCTVSLNQDNAHLFIIPTFHIVKRVSSKQDILTHLPSGRYAFFYFAKNCFHSGTISLIKQTRF